MKNMARNISLLVNAFLLILIATGALWGLKKLHRQDPTEAERLVKEKTYFKDYLNSSVQASTKLGLKFPVIETTDILHDTNNLSLIGKVRERGRPALLKSKMLSFLGRLVSCS